MNGLFIFTILTATSSFVQYIFYQDLRNLIYQGWDPHLYRMFGVFFDTSVSGAIYGLLFLLIFMHKEKFIKNKIRRRTLLAILFLAIILSYNRTLYITFTVLAIVYLVSRKKLKELFVLLVLFMLLVLISPKPFGEGVNLLRTASIVGRVEDYQNAYKLWIKNPLFGVGYNRIRYVKSELNIIPAFNSNITHSGASFSSSFLIILVSGGIIGLTLFVLIFLKLSLADEFSKYLLIYLGLLSVLDNILLQPFILFLTFSILATFSNNLFDKSQ